MEKCHSSKYKIILERVLAFKRRLFVETPISQKTKRETPYARIYGNSDLKKINPLLDNRIQTFVEALFCTEHQVGSLPLF